MFLYKKMITVAIVLVLFCLLITHTHAALTQPEISGPNAVSSAINNFSIKALEKTAEISKGSLNLALSSYTLWTLMSIIHEGARNDTAADLERALKIPPCDQACQDNFRQSYTRLSQFLSNSVQDVILNMASGVFVKYPCQVKAEFKRVARNAYGVNVTAANFKDKEKAATYINEYLTRKSGQHIKNFVNEADINYFDHGPKLFLTSVLYFKGLWQTPFNLTATKRVPFFNEYRKPLGEVEMMYLRTHVPFTMIFDRRAAVAELKYGDGDRISMIVVVPKWNTLLREILALLANTPISKILEALTEFSQKYVDEHVNVYLPRFKIKSDFVMNTVLVGLGLHTLFDDRANLSGIIPSKEFFITKVVQRTVIKVNEEGTTPAAAGGAGIIDKSLPGELRANRPFAYFIVDKPSQTVLLAGTVENPSSI